MNPEKDRLNGDRKKWLAWGPYLSERQWGTVREDYSHDGNAWSHFPHDDARRQAYRWGEDGIGGFSDAKQRICLAVAMWNGVDPILKERLFGLTKCPRQPWRDAKELYYYLDATPSHSYMKMLYKYPQAAFPYEQLVNENGRRDKQQSEYDLIDTGLFEEDRYFDVFVEYAKAAHDDILMRVTAHNRGPDPARLVLLPQLGFATRGHGSRTANVPRFEAVRLADKTRAVQASHPHFPQWVAFFDAQTVCCFAITKRGNPISPTRTVRSRTLFTTTSCTRNVTLSIHSQ